MFQDMFDSSCLTFFYFAVLYFNFHFKKSFIVPRNSITIENFAVFKFYFGSQNLGKEFYKNSQTLVKFDLGVVTNTCVICDCLINKSSGLVQESIRKLVEIRTNPLFSNLTFFGQYFH